MAAILDATVGVAAYCTFREPAANPLDPRCALHLQRICGTCAHFQGVLRPADGASDRADCGYFGGERHRLKKAGRCVRWARKGQSHG